MSPNNNASLFPSVRCNLSDISQQNYLFVINNDFFGYFC